MILIFFLFKFFYYIVYKMNPLGLLGQRHAQHRGGAGILPLYTNYARGPAFFFVTELVGHAQGQGAIPYGMVDHGTVRIEKSFAFSIRDYCVKK